MPTDEEVAKLREQESADPALAPEEPGEQAAQPRGEAARSALSIGCVGAVVAMLVAIVGVVLMVSVQPMAIVVILAAIGIALWSRSKLKEAEPHVR
jgi:hypothetical protein